MRRNAFTIIELLVVIGIIGLLIGLVLPALSGARTRARQTLSLANARSIAQSFELYGNEYRVLPFPGQVDDGGRTGELPEDFYSLNWYADDGIAIIAISDVWPMATLWPALVSAVTPWDEAFATWVSPGRSKELPTIDDVFGDREPQEVISYEFSQSFFARPRLWSGTRDNPARADRSLVAPTKPSDVRSPASKVMLFDGDLAYQTRQPEIVEGHYDAPTPMAFADGHGDVLSPLDAVDGAPNPLNGTDIRRLHNTPDGVQGTDY
ncbi:MAG: prepilin-type N-terminal cleavage/methylation domain-containing protein [Phycisphaerales bacterium]